MIQSYNLKIRFSQNVFQGFRSFGKIPFALLLCLSVTKFCEVVLHTFSLVGFAILTLKCISQLINRISKHFTVKYLQIYSFQQYLKMQSASKHWNEEPKMFLALEFEIVFFFNFRHLPKIPSVMPFF